jgi:maltooligosyltrehalose synthase
MTGAHDPDCRRPFLWNWLEDSERVEVHDYFRQAATLRRESPCFTRGDFETVLAEGSVFAFRRSAGDDHAIVVLNAGETDATVEIPVGSVIEEYLSSRTSSTAMSVDAMVNLITKGLSTIERPAEVSTFKARIGAMSGAIYVPWKATLRETPDEQK